MFLGLLLLPQGILILGQALSLLLDLLSACMRNTAFSSLNLIVSWRRTYSCRSLANCLLSMAWRHLELSSSSLADEQLREGVVIFAGV